MGGFRGSKTVRRASVVVRNPERLTQRLLDRFDALDHIACARAIHAAKRKLLKRLWIGDSHGPFLAGVPLRRFAVSEGCEAVVWLGPRLMYSIARNGFPDPLIPELRGIELHLATTPIVLTLGEIDCRVHLAQRLHTAGNLDFVARYVQRAAELRTNLGACHTFVVGPVPPSDMGTDDPAYSRSGTLQQRVVASRLLERRLCEATAQVGEPWVSAIPIGDLVGDSETGALAARFTHDGCHLNVLGAELVRERLDAATVARCL